MEFCLYVLTSDPASASLYCDRGTDLSFSSSTSFGELLVQMAVYAQQCDSRLVIVLDKRLPLTVQQAIRTCLETNQPASEQQIIIEDWLNSHLSRLPPPLS